MTRKKSRVPAKSPSASRARTTSTGAGPRDEQLKGLLRKEVFGLILTTMGAITLVSLGARNQGALSSAWAMLLRRGFGVGALPVALVLTLGGLALILHDSIDPALRQRLTPRWQTVVGCELLFFAGLGLIHGFSSGVPAELARAGKGGGLIGWALDQSLAALLGPFLGKLTLVAIAVVGAYLTTGRWWAKLLWWVRRAGAAGAVRLRALLEAHRTSAQAPAEPLATPPRGRAELLSSEPARAPLGVEARSGLAAAPKPAPSDAAKAVKRPRPPREAGRHPVSLPPLDLLTPDVAASGEDADVRQRAQVIEETLEAFGVPAEVVDWHRGPVVTQFDVEPGFVEREDRDGTARRYKIRVSKILSLTNDLALALAAAPIRIQAPVPGRPVVGIEVPNAEKTMVGLRGVLESPQFAKLHGSLRIALGRDVSGQPVVADLSGMPHLLIAGATGSGKSVCLNAIIASLLFFNTPEQLKLVMVDPKRVELTKYNGIPHLMAPVIVDVPKVIVALRWLTREMDSRYKQFAQTGARDLESYNRAAGSKRLEALPTIVLIIDELADLMLSAPDDTEATVCRLAQMARATGIHLVIATQRPSVDVVTGLIKANFPARISFAVSSQVDSRVILDTPGAEKLLGRGDMLFMSPETAELRRIQGCFASDKELDALVAYWQTRAREELSEGEAEEMAPPWEGTGAEGLDADDEELQRALELVREHNQASASFLQRHLRIGYPKAARLVDALEARGYIGPPESGGRSREVIQEAFEERPSQNPEDVDGAGRAASADNGELGDALDSSR